MDSGTLLGIVEKERAQMVDSLVSMLRVKAVGPENGGQGEAERGKFLIDLVRRLGFESVEVLQSRDPSVPTGERPNILVRLRGQSSERTVWVITHMDTVPEGDISAWKYPPYDPTIVEGRIYGRGSEDNGQELIASLFGLHAVLNAKLTPEYDVGLAFVSDEEHGNTHGIDMLLSKPIFKKGDLVVVPDHGQADGSMIAIVEKSIAWIGVEVVGRQTHASLPHRGINAFEIGARYMAEVVEQLRTKFSKSDPLFDAPTSTFEPTKCDPSTPNINTVPGRFVFAFDCRVLPDYSLDDVMSVFRTVADAHEARSGAKIVVTFLQRADAAPKTGEQSEIVKRLSKAIEAVRGVRPHAMGVGGGTCAAPFRRKGIEAAVWSTIAETAHDANEYANVDDLVADAKVYALLFAGRSIENV